MFMKIFVSLWIDSKERDKSACIGLCCIHIIDWDDWTVLLKGSVDTFRVLLKQHLYPYSFLASSSAFVTDTVMDPCILLIIFLIYHFSY